MAFQVGIAGHHAALVTIFGILGNLISGMVFLAPIPTFWKTYKTGTTNGVNPLPYFVSIFGCFLWLYYAIVKTKQPYVLAINITGIVIEGVYIAIYLVYSTRHLQIRTAKLVLLNVAVLLSIIVAVQLIPKTFRLEVLGYICDLVTVGVFGAPLSVIVKVIRTRDVKLIPFPLAVCLTLCSIIWFTYGVFYRDFFIMMPNIIGFVLGIVQMTIVGIITLCFPPEEQPANQEAVEDIV